MILPIVIAIVLVAGLAAAFFAIGGRASKVGTLSRETRSRDTSARDAAGSEVVPADSAVPAEQTELPAPPKPIDEETLGVNRRKFLNRGLLSLVGLGGLASFGGALLAFIWPPDRKTPVWDAEKKRIDFVPLSSGFGGKISAGSTADITAYIAANRREFYVPEARTYLRPYPRLGAKPDEAAAAVAKAKAVYPASVVSGMEAGWTAIFQKCVHLGCKVPWCGSSQWFECPCHGSKYNAVGEKKDGPAPRGLDRFAISVGSSIVIDTGVVVSGPPIGTDTTGQKAEGPSCI